MLQIRRQQRALVVVVRKEEPEGWSEALPRRDVQRVGSGEALVWSKGEAEGSALREKGFASNDIATLGNNFLMNEQIDALKMLMH